MAFDAGAATGKIILDTTAWTAGTEKVKKTGKGLKTAFSSLAKNALRLGVGIAAALTPAIMKANQFQKEFANVTTLVDDPTLFDPLKQGILSLDSALGSSIDLTNGLYQAISASVEPGKAIQFVAESAMFAKAALVDTNTAVDLITTGINAYGLESDKAADISDKLFSVIKLGKTTGAELAAVMGQSIPLAANMGVSFDELGASIAIMTRQGINASEATTQFNGVINALLKPSTDMTAQLEKLGFETGKSALESLGFKGTIDALSESVDGSEQRLAGMFRNTRALKGVMALTGKGAKDFANVLDEIETSAGATQKAFEKQELTFETLTNNLEKATIQIGESLLPSLQTWVTEMNTFFEDNKAEISAILGNLPEIFTKTFDLVIDIMKKALEWDTFSKLVGNLASGIFDSLEAVIFKIPSMFKIALEFLLVPIKKFGTFAGLQMEKLIADSMNSIIVAINVLPLIDLPPIGFKDPGDMEDIWTSTIDLMGVEFEKLGVVVGTTLAEVAGVATDTGSDIAGLFKDELSAFDLFLAGLIAKEQDAIEENERKLKESTTKVGDTFGGVLDGIVEANGDAVDTMAEDWEAWAEGVKDAVLEITSEISNVFGFLGSISDQYFENQKIALENQGLSEEELAKKQKELRIEKAKADKTGAIFGAIVSTALTIDPWYAALIGTLGAIQIGFIAAQPIPSFAAGTTFAPGGMSLVGEEGPELVNLPRGASVIPAGETARALGGKIEMNNTFIVNDDTTAEIVSRKLGRRFEKVMRTI